MKKTLLLLMLTCSCAIATAQERSPLRQTEFISADSLEDEHELLERVRNMPNLEVGKGITFRPKSNWFSLTMRFRMQNMVGLSFDKDFTLTKTDAQSSACACASTGTSIPRNWSIRFSWDSPPTTRNRCPTAI